MENLVLDEMLVVEVDAIRRVADIVGPSSAAAKALVELERRRKAGEDAVVLKKPGTTALFVGPRPIREPTETQPSP